MQFHKWQGKNYGSCSKCGAYRETTNRYYKNPETGKWEPKRTYHYTTKVNGKLTYKWEYKIPDCI